MTEMPVDPTEELEARIGAILAAVENAERRRARELMLALFERLAECDPITVAAYKLRIRKMLGMPAETFWEMLHAAQQKERRRGMEAVRERYDVVAGRICALEYDATSMETAAHALCNFSVRIVEETVLDEGAGEAEREFLIEGALENGEALPQVRVSEAAFESMRWVGNSWGLRAQRYARREQLRDAILQLSQGASRRTAFAHTGWREVEGRHLFVNAGGAIGSGPGTPASTREGAGDTDRIRSRGEGEAAVQLDMALERYWLPVQREAERAREGMIASLRLLELASKECGRQGDDENGRAAEAPVTLWAAMYLAPLGPFLSLDFVIWLYGVTGTLKSTLLALALGHYGEFTRTTLPASWESTSNALGKLLFLSKDVPLVIDDLAPGAREGGELEEKAKRVIRSVGNRAGRGRMRADLSLEAAYPPRGLVLCSGEQLPLGQSILARTLPVELRRGDLDLDKLSEMQSLAGRLPHAMAGYLAWVAERWEDLVHTLPQEWNRRRKGIGGEGHLRLPEMYASLGAARDLAVRYAVEIGAASAEEAVCIQRRADEVWQRVVRRQGERLARERPTAQFLEALQEMLLRGTVYLERTAGPARGGRGTLIGWEDEQYYYILPRIAYERAATYCRGSGTRLVVKPGTLQRQLYEEGFLEADPEGERLTVVKWAGQGAHRILAIRKAAVNRVMAGK